MSIQFRCDKCGREYDLPDEAGGRKAKCECGVLLVVPVETPAAEESGVFDPAAPSEIVTAPTPKPPRTLAAAVKQAAPPPPPLPPPPPVPEVEAPPEPPPVAPPPTPAEPDLPPPLPPAYQAKAEPTEPRPPVERRYRHLRAYCGWLRLVAWLLAAATALAVLTSVTDAFVKVQRTGANPLLIASLVIPTLIWAAAGAGLFVLINAAAELLRLLMDIEENTRRR